MKDPAELAYDDQMLAGVVAKVNRLVAVEATKHHGPSEVVALATRLRDAQDNSPHKLAVIAAVAVHQLAQRSKADA